MTSPNATVESHKVGGGFKLLGWIALALGVLMVLVVLFSHRGLYQVYRFRHDRQRLEQENARLAAENASLDRAIDRLQHDPVFIQDRIRQELNFVKKNEIIFQFAPEKPANVPDLSTIGNADPAASRGQAISARNIEKSKWVAPPSDGPKSKRASRRRD